MQEKSTTALLIIKEVDMHFTKIELAELMYLVNSAVMKSNLHNGLNHKRTRLLYGIRDKLKLLEVEQHGKRN